MIVDNAIAPQSSIVGTIWAPLVEGGTIVGSISGIMFFPVIDTRLSTIHCGTLECYEPIKAATDGVGTIKGYFGGSMLSGRIVGSDQRVLEENSDILREDITTYMALEFQVSTRFPPLEHLLKRFELTPSGFLGTFPGGYDQACSEAWQLMNR